MADLKAELAKDLDQAEWEWLIPHVKRDSVLIIAKELNLVDVGIAIASDNLQSVQHWISEQLIQKPSETQLSDWNSDPQKRFNTLIVQPYVLIQEL
ncbi:MAG: DUF2288 domain-containing protein [Tatlockia sp.]|jgi:hypothetical protein|nr:DUF2288 domain-containing protein [Tatlockia sp.]